MQNYPACKEFKNGTVKPVLSGHSKRSKLVFKTDYRLMQVKSIAECSKEHSAILSTFIELLLILSVQSGRVVKAYEYYQTCIATKTFEFFGFLSEARNDTQI